MSDILAALEEIKRLIAAGAVMTPRTRVTKCTQAAFDTLPATVSRSEFMAWTGYGRQDLAEEIRTGRIKVYRPNDHTKARYYKSEIARLGGWKM